MSVRDRRRVVEVIQPLKSGFTQPYLCRLDDDQLYAVKGRSALPEGLLAEACAAILGQAMGLPVPNFVTAEIPPALIAVSADAELANSLGTGLGFASLWQNACEPLTPAIRDQQSPTFLATLYAFDHWIANGDRSLGAEEGNPNLLYKLADKKLVVFDHNLAFSLGYVAEELDTHAGRRSWTAIGRSREFLRDLREKMAESRAVLNGSVGDLPDEWLDERPDFVANANETLDRSTTLKFWAELG